jgi:hypothetical protein
MTDKMMDGMQTAHPLFREEQRMEPRLFYLVGVAVLLPFVVFWLLPHEDLPNSARPIIFGIMLGTVLLTLVFYVLVYYMMRLTTEVREDGISLKCGALFRGPLEVPHGGIVSHNVVSARSMLALAKQHRGKLTWKMLRDELTLRLKNRRVWVMNGGRGVRLDYRDGTHFLIGSRQPEKLHEAIALLRRRFGNE